MAMFELTPMNGEVKEINGAFTIGEGGSLRYRAQNENTIYMSPAAWVSIEVIEEGSAFGSS